MTGDELALVLPEKMGTCLGIAMSNFVNISSGGDCDWRRRGGGVGHV